MMKEWPTESIISAQQVESMQSLAEEHQCDESEISSLMDISSALVKETFMKALSGPLFEMNNNTYSNSNNNDDKDTSNIVDNPENNNDYIEADTCSTTNENSSDNAALYSSSSSHLCAKLSQTLTKANVVIDMNRPSQTPTISTPSSKMEHIIEDIGSITNSNLNTTSNSNSLELDILMETEPTEANSVAATVATESVVTLATLQSALSIIDLVQSISLIDRMSEEIETNVSNTLLLNKRVLGREFDEGQDTSNRKNSFASVQDMGQVMLEKDVKMSVCAERTEKESQQSSNASALAYEMEIAKLKAEVHSYRQELEKIRPDRDDVVLKCNSLAIDPAIATVPHLLALLNSAQDQNQALQNENKDLNDKLFHTTDVLEQLKKLYIALKSKLKSIDLEDDRRIENKVGEICNYFEERLRHIKQELTMKGVQLNEEDFWSPHHSTTMTEFLLEVLAHKDEVAEEKLRQDLSNTDTDKFLEDDDEPIVNPVGGFRASIVDPSTQGMEPLFEDDDAPDRMHKMRQQISSVSAKTCSVQ